MDNKRLATEIVKIAGLLLAVPEYEYQYDPHHEKKPHGGGWEKTEKGWRRAPQKEKRNFSDERKEAEHWRKNKKTVDFKNVGDIGLTEEQAAKIKKPEDAEPLLKKMWIQAQFDFISHDNIPALLKKHGLKGDKDNIRDLQQKLVYLAAKKINEQAKKAPAKRQPQDLQKQKFPMPANPHKKVKAMFHPQAKIQNILAAHGLDENSDVIQEMAGFKKTLGQQVPEKDIGKWYVRNIPKLKKDFLANMNPNNYGSPLAFKNAQKRIKDMPNGDFGKILAAIFDEEEDEV